MDEADKKQVEGICWRTIFIAVVLVGIGVVIGRVTVGMCPLSPMGKWGGGHGMKSCWNKGGSAGKCRMTSKCQPGCTCPKCCRKAGMCQPGCMCPMCCQKAGVCKPGCTCPKCLKKTTCLSDPNKASCPMMEKKTAESGKD